MNADNIVVIAKGEVVQEGIHSRLLEHRNGPYWKLVNAQQLATSTVRLVRDDSDDFQIPRSQSFIAEKESYETLVESENTAVDDATETTQTPSHNMFRSFGLLLFEQRRNGAGYLIMILAAMGAASKFMEAACFLGGVC
jgi:ABC-type glutathione transport system ATPase component